MSKNEVLKAFDQLSPDDQQAVRTEITQRAAAGCCGPDEMQHHMAAMMKMMQSSKAPLECCQQMMGMCQEMIQKATESTSR